MFSFIGEFQGFLGGGETGIQRGLHQDFPDCLGGQMVIQGRGDVAAQGFQSGADSECREAADQAIGDGQARAGPDAAIGCLGQQVCQAGWLGG